MRKPNDELLKMFGKIAATIKKRGTGFRGRIKRMVLVRAASRQSTSKRIEKNTSLVGESYVER